MERKTVFATREDALLARQKRENVYRVLRRTSWSLSVFYIVANDANGARVQLSRSLGDEIEVSDNFGDTLRSIENLSIEEQTKLATLIADKVKHELLPDTPVLQDRNGTARQSQPTAGTPNRAAS